MDITVSQESKENLKIFCNASGNPMPKLSWKHNNNSITSLPTINNIEDCKSRKTGIYQHKNKDNVLIICNLNFLDHSGQYECRAENTLSSVVETLELTVYGK